MSLPILHRDIPVIDRAAQLLGITGAAALAGITFSLSAYTIPALLDAPAKVAVNQWRRVYELGKRSAPPSTIIITGLFTYLAYRERKGSSASVRLYAAAAALAPSIIPYTIVAMESTNKELIDRDENIIATSAEIASRDSATKALLDRWASLNVVRSIILFSSAALGAWASLSPIEVLSVDKIDLISGANRLG